MSNMESEVWCQSLQPRLLLIPDVTGWHVAESAPHLCRSTIVSCIYSIGTTVTTSLPKSAFPHAYVECALLVRTTYHPRFALLTHFSNWGFSRMQPWKFSSKENSWRTVLDSTDRSDNIANAFTKFTHYLATRIPSRATTSRLC